MTDGEKMEAFGRMVFGMMTDVLIMPVSDEAFGRRTVTMPDGKGGKHALELIIATKGVADVMEQAVSERMEIKNVDDATGSAQ